MMDDDTFGQCNANEAAVFHYITYSCSKYWFEQCVIACVYLPVCPASYLFIILFAQGTILSKCVCDLQHGDQHSNWACKSASCSEGVHSRK